MGKFAKWIGGGLGWAFLGPIGGILGFVVGSVIDEQTAPTGERVISGYTTPGDFAMSLLVLVAAVMKADGTVMKSELDYVKANFVRLFGRESASEAIRMLRDLLKQNIPTHDVCIQIQHKLDYPSRLQLLHFLYGIVVADGEAKPREIDITEYIARNLGISDSDRSSIKAMFVPETDNAYKILEIDSSASNEEVKKAYRKMAMKYHPDKVSYLGDDIRKEADKKFKMVNEAYEQIKKQRGIV